jgi:hypothetical protein
MHRVVPVLILILSVALVSSCSDSDDNVIGTTPSKYSKYKDLVERDHVLVNLELSYNDRNLERLVELLDDDFVFQFSPSDFREGHVGVEQWNRTAEVAATTNLFDPNYSGPREPVRDIDLSLTYSDADTSWKAVTPEDQEKYPGETWYVKTLRYTMTTTSGYVAYIGYNILASFVVRSVDVNGRTIWRIVEWYDDVENPASRHPVKTTDWGAIVEETTWGQAKVLYAP